MFRVDASGSMGDNLEGEHFGTTAVERVTTRWFQQFYILFRRFFFTMPGLILLAVFNPLKSGSNSGMMDYMNHLP
jgi:hypothetical protein